MTVVILSKKRLDIRICATPHIHDKSKEKPSIMESENEIYSFTTGIGAHRLRMSREIEDSPFQN
jgi:hypothetical protein